MICLREAYLYPSTVNTCLAEIEQLPGLPEPEMQLFVGFRQASAGLRLHVIFTWIQMWGQDPDPKIFLCIPIFF